ncbi:putative monovalent cation/H+ antiporter subunit A [Aridibaculum aurantiacum]|uniref:putative monovalent cation/H+ antiporter subunit A n=1 Tax=Aridibaculum aurantiacum TaxID=2810307 RepID=UPI001A97B475|nr:putative monovalent cation/H+ antiporter subunit A [Aridibaculum aurantiacum]
MHIAVLSGFVVAAMVLLAGRLLKGYQSLILSLLPVSLFIYFLSFIPRLADGNTVMYSYPWIPSLGVQLDYHLDGLSLLFCLLITGIGSLIFIYAAAYMKGYNYVNRFFCYLSMFMASMLGLVLSDNVLALFVFWELTSISSFFLIGFNNDNPDSRKSSLLALAITGGGGFLLMAGFILMGSTIGSFSISEMITSRSVLQNSEHYWLMLLLICGGAFTKSAQFPFHFWLPGAMKAPTPVSAYLHSATMVKAGVYLLARLTPVLGQNIYWNNTLMIVGGITMVYAAFHSLFRTDLKTILAYTTISALGILVFLLGIGTQQALIAAAVFILVHALYKAGLFLVTGIIDHETGTRDVTVLSGLRKVMMPVAIAGIVAAISSAGIPFTFGFLGKDLIYEGTLSSGNNFIFLTALAVVTNIMLLYAGFVAGIKPFTGNIPSQFHDVHLPSLWMWLPPLLLGILSMIFGFFPALIDNSLVQPVVRALHGGPVDIPLKIWHGFNLVLLLSAITLVGGFLLYKYIKPSSERIHAVDRFREYSPAFIIPGIATGVHAFARHYTRIMQNGYLRIYVLVIVLFLVVLLSYKLFTGVNIYIDESKLHEITIYEAVVTGIMLFAIFKTVFTSSRLIAVAAMGVVGYCICLLFVFYSAPDLAMTQFTIDTLTVVLFVLVLFRLPPFLHLTNAPVKIRDGLVALSFGTLLSIIALEVINETATKDITEFYAKNSYVFAKGKNVVNVILVDFRGMDTLVEITVLTIAAIGVYSMLKLKIGLKEKE